MPHGQPPKESQVQANLWQSDKVLGSPHENVCLCICSGSGVLQLGVKRARDQQNGIFRSGARTWAEKDQGVG